MLEIRSHRWTDKWGRKCAADYYPFVGDEPVDEIAGCEHCELYTRNADCCLGWRDNPQDAPLFCGPICLKFAPTAATQVILDTIQPEGEE